MGYAFIDHTADVAADLEGSSAADLFVFAAQALTDTMTDIKDVKAAVTQAVTLESASLEDLLVDWLNELLYRFEVRNMLVTDAAVVVEERGGRWRVDGTVRGEPFDPARHPSRVLVKSATYHGLHVTRDGDAWRARIVFDI
jgi:SHS2 domain-containing protein